MEKTVKFIVTGEGGVGKTTFLNKLINNNFDSKSELTKGFDFYSMDLRINEIKYHLIFWDLAGQPHFKKILTDFADGSIAAIILVDLTRMITLEGIPEWRKKIIKYGEIPILLLGTKYDLIDPNETKFIDDSLNRSKEKNDDIVDYLKISSKTGYNIKEA